MTNGQRVLDEIIRRHGSDNFRIAFCPYKAGMWDAMESIFDACLYKPNINPVICPISFTEVDYLGKVGLFKTETSHLKKIISRHDCFIDSEQLDAFNPDYIVLHYPYDQNNSVTRIKEDFWSTNLKIKGYKIIYSPYYIPFGGISSDDLVHQPVLKNSWLIAEDSKEEAQNVIDCWKNHGIDLTDRIVITGSPKRDLLWDAEETGITNTTLIAGSLIPLLNRFPQHIKKLQQTITDELALNKKVILRLHPLASTGIRSKTPQYYQSWLLFLGWCQELTESHDFMFDRNLRIQDTMNECDYMFAETGSAVELWKGTSKPYEVI